MDNNSMTYLWRPAYLPVLIFILMMVSFCSPALGDRIETSISIKTTPDAPPEGCSFTVTGTLTDSTGSPLGNKRVNLESSPDGDQAYPFERIGTGATDRDGRFEFFRGNNTPAEFIRVSYLGNAQYLGSTSEIIPVHDADTAGAKPHSSRTSGSLLLTGSPDNSVVLLDGEVRGVTPLSLSGIESGPHIIEIGKPGYQNQTIEVFVDSGRTTTFSFSLPPAGADMRYAGMKSE
ncbi:MAG: PEGA domain-containing protein, partial [Methanomicrobiales archaeon]|nr:PEGA domain-containing protein [Methanomicrobiales archaeon]